MDTKHTPGPWKRNADGFLASPKGAEVVFSRKHQLIIGDSTPETEANARLIASAPDLLEALARIEKLLTPTGEKHNNPALNVDLCAAIASAAIAKARGEEGEVERESGLQES